MTENIITIANVLEVVGDEGDEGDEGDRLCHYVAVEVSVDGAEHAVGVMVGARESAHGSVRAAGGDVRPHCTAWWVDDIDYATVAERRDEVLAALKKESWRLYCEACSHATR